MTRRSAYRLGDNAFVKVEQGELGQILPGIFLRIYHCINTTGMFMERFVELESVGTDLKSQLGIWPNFVCHVRDLGSATTLIPLTRKSPSNMLRDVLFRWPKEEYLKWNGMENKKRKHRI